MEVLKLTKLMKLEWMKLKQKTIMSELIIYWLILMFLPLFFIKMINSDFGQNIDSLFTLILSVQVGFVLFGASLINQVFIDEFKSRTISLSYSYPISRKKLFLVKILFIGLLVFIATIVSFILTVAATLLINQTFPFINVVVTGSDTVGYVDEMLIRSVLVTLISFIPLFYFAIWKRAVVPAVICAIFVMQLPNFSTVFNLSQDLMIALLSVLGVISIYFSIKYAETLGEI